jgi:type IV pilus assembly protein PilW
MRYMYLSKKNIRRSRGLGLTDLMVGLAIGLLATLVVIKVAVLFEARRKSTTGIADAQMNASYALANLARDIRMAGHGLGPSEALGCIVRRTSGTTVLPDWILRPVTLINGADGAPDILLVLSSGKAQSLTAARLIAPYTVSSDELMVNSTLGMALGDTLLLHESGNTECPLIKITGIPTGEYQVRHTSLPAGLLTATEYQEGSAIINLGTIHHQRYTINSNNQLLLERYDAATNQWQGSAFASDVVSLQAQLGYDARATLSGALRVTRWSAAAFDANANGTAGDADDFRRILAIRIAVVSRSAQRSDQGCSSAIPTWRAANESTGVMEETPIAVNTINDWACYRYRVLQAEIPLRNMIWSDS